MFVFFSYILLNFSFEESTSWGSQTWAITNFCKQNQPKGLHCSDSSSKDIQIQSINTAPVSLLYFQWVLVWVHLRIQTRASHDSIFKWFYSEQSSRTGDLSLCQNSESSAIPSPWTCLLWATQHTEHHLWRPWRSSWLAQAPGVVNSRNQQLHTRATEGGQLRLSPPWHPERPRGCQLPTPLFMSSFSVSSANQDR